MAKYNHAYDIAFEVISDTEDASDVTVDMLRAAVDARIGRLDHNGDLAWEHAVDLFDTFEIDPVDEKAMDVLRKRYVGSDLERRRALCTVRRESDHEQELHDEGRLKDDD